jgi:hypothetical protein
VERGGATRSEPQTWNPEERGNRRGAFYLVDSGWWFGIVPCNLNL